MIYDMDRKKIHNSLDCLDCQYFDKRLKKCGGLGKRCNEYDFKTMTVIDYITKLPFKKLKGE